MDPSSETLFQYLPSDMQADPAYAGYKDMTALDLLRGHADLSGKVQSAAEAQAQLESKLKVAIEPLPEGATEVQRKEYDAKLRGLVGVPENPGGYKVTLPENVPAEDPLLGAYLVAAHAEGMSQKQVQAGINSFLEYAQKAETAQREAADKALKIQWGNKYDDNIKKAYLALEWIAKESGVPESELNGLMHLRSNPSWVTMLFNLSRHYSEDGMARGVQGVTEKSLKDKFFPGAQGIT
jgi:hypothetical protein